MIAYVDSSVLLRLVLAQPGRLKEWTSMQAGVASTLMEVECLRTIDRLRLRGAIDDEQVAERREAVYTVTDEMLLVAPDSTILQRAAQPFPTPLRTLDAVHLATALRWRESREPELVMATHDHGLATAARAMGFRVVGVESGSRA